MRGVVIIYKRDREDAARLATELKKWLQAKGISVQSQQNPTEVPTESPPPLLTLPDNTDLIVVLGGDGTFLSVARTLENRMIPVIGVNLGGFGFLTEINRESCFQELEQIFQGHYEIEKRMRLQVNIYRQDRIIFQQSVLNDVVINKGTLARIINLKTSIDSCYLTHYRADGLIIATPTGSTAYNLSAGGPIVYPTADVIILTPICPFTLSNRPLILPSSAVIRIELEGRSQDIVVTCDGQIGCQLHPHDQIVIRAAKQPLQLVRSPSTNYFEILRAKLKWGQY